MAGQRDEPDDGFSVLEREPPLQLARWLRFAPPGGFGAGRRALGFAMFCWLPIAAWALATGNLHRDPAGESLLQHYSVHARCLLFIPLLILAEPLFYRMTRMYSVALAQATGLGRSEPLQAAVARLCRLRSSGWPWLVLLLLTVAFSCTPGIDANEDALAWARGSGGRLGFGGVWYLWIVRPVSTFLLLAWVWRLLLLTLWLWKVARLDPRLVPTHPDRTAGLGFLEDLPIAFSLVTFAVSVQIASRLAHEILVHGTPFESYLVPLAGLGVLWSLLLLAPLLVYLPLLVTTRRRALLEYSALVGRQGRLVHRRWILGEEVGADPLLNAPEIGPSADAATMFESVRRMRPLPFGWRSLAGTLLPLAVPMLALYALQSPVSELWLYLLKMLA